jgi:hypothetical protein
MTLPRTTSATQIGDLAVTISQKVFEENDWKFRRQSSSDFGVDAECERVIPPFVTGRLIKLQIKGTRRIDWDNEGRYAVTVKASTWRLWNDMNLPTVAILCVCDDSKAYWLSPFEVSPKEGAYSVRLPFKRSQCLSDDFLEFSEFARAIVRFFPGPEFIWEVPGYYEMLVHQLIPDRDCSDYCCEIDRDQDHRVRLFYQHTQRLRTAVGLPVHHLLPLEGFYLRSRAFADWGEGPLFREVFSELVDYLIEPYGFL